MNKSNELKILGALALAASYVTPKAYATAIIANDTFEGLPALGTNLGNFLLNLTPGVIALVFAMAVIGGVVAIFYAVSKKIGGAVGGRMK